MVSSFCLSKDKNGEPIRHDDGNPVMKDVEKETVKIAEIDLTDAGLQFVWKDGDRNIVEKLNPHQQDEWHQIKNRILLSKLRITIGDNQPHVVDLWTPLHGPQTTPWVMMDDTSKYYAISSEETRTSRSNRTFYQLPSGKKQTCDLLDKETEKSLSNLSTTMPKQIRTYLLSPTVSSPLAQDQRLLLRTK